MKHPIADGGLEVQRAIHDADTERAKMERWLSDGNTWIGVFENKHFKSPALGRRVALPFDDEAFEQCEIGSTRAPDVGELDGLGWQYTLIAKVRSVDAVLMLFREVR